MTFFGEAFQASVPLGLDLLLHADYILWGLTCIYVEVSRACIVDLLGSIV